MVRVEPSCRIVVRVIKATDDWIWKEFIKVKKIQPRRIRPIHRIRTHIRIQVDTTSQPNRILTQKPPSMRLVPPVAHVVDARLFTNVQCTLVLRPVAIRFRARTQRFQRQATPDDVVVDSTCNSVLVVVDSA